VLLPLSHWIRTRGADAYSNQGERHQLILAVFLFCVVRYTVYFKWGSQGLLACDELTAATSTLLQRTLSLPQPSGSIFAQCIVACYADDKDA